MQLHLFYHVWMTNHWREIVAEYLDVIRASGLLDNARLYVGAIGSPDEFIALATMLRGDAAAVLHFGEDPEQYEFPTLELLREYSANNSGAVCYAHTKGVSREADAELCTWWRQTMNEGVLRNWRRCVRAIDSGADVAGCRFSLGGQPLPYYAGNFWWASCDYIRTLPEISRQSRFEAEIWLFRNKAVGMDIPVEKSL